MVLYTDINLIQAAFMVAPLGIVASLLGLGGTLLGGLFNRKSQADKDAQAAQPKEGAHTGPGQYHTRDRPFPVGLAGSFSNRSPAEYVRT